MCVANASYSAGQFISSFPNIGGISKQAMLLLPVAINPWPQLSSKSVLLKFMHALKKSTQGDPSTLDPLNIPLNCKIDNDNVHTHLANHGMVNTRTWYGLAYLQ